MAQGQKTGGRKAGTPNKDTLVKELLVENLWDKVSGLVTSEGIDKCWLELNKMSGKDYVYGFLSLMEYFKPKLQRSTLSNDPDNPITPTLIVVPTGAQLPLATTETQIDGDKDPRYATTS